MSTATSKIPANSLHRWGERHGQIVDPFGHRWGLAQRLRDVSPQEILRGAERMFAAAGEDD